MEQIKRFQVRGLPGWVRRVNFSGRIVDYWAPDGGSNHVLIAHDGQNIFDRKTATFIYTWKLAQTSLRVARELKVNPPVVIGVFHSTSKIDPNGRAKDLCPEDPFQDGMKPTYKSEIRVVELRGNAYLNQIFEEIVPQIERSSLSKFVPEQSAMIGSSMGGLATLYSAIKFPEKFRTALALSTHWPLAGDQLVDWMIPKLPKDSGFKVWMSRGTKGLDASYPPFQNRADQLMRDHGWSGTNFKSKVFHRSTHNERSWASYLDEPIRFWLT
ncbi:MAG: hypothetical protein RLZZ12_793 [Actinomycetota bacterium]|jgi:predicted alpha/beta superfamily hydrolase